jgi:glycosyltransferase involved in cell wall biosynthesis
MSIVIVTGAMAPYTHRLYDALAAVIDEPLHVLVCVEREPARSWELAHATRYQVEVLPGLRWHRDAATNLYFNPSVDGRLRALKPRLVIVGDFSPTSLFAVLAARRQHIPIGLHTDGVLATDPGAHSMMRRMMRRAIVNRVDFGIGPSFGSLQLLHFLGVPSDRLVMAPLVAGWMPTVASPAMDQRPYDVLFCGELSDTRKGAGFFADVVEAMAIRRRTLTVRVVGDGPLRGELERRFAAAGVTVHFDGFLQQAALEEVYNSAKVFLFPSRGDPWGVVVNEAVQCGTPVVASVHATAACELVAAAQAGNVLPLRQADWVEATLALIDDREGWQRTHDRALAAACDTFLDTAVNAYRRVIEDYAR